MIATTTSNEGSRVNCEQTQHVSQYDETRKGRNGDEGEEGQGGSRGKRKRLQGTIDLLTPPKTPDNTGAELHHGA